jgi:hypothetical protein
MGENKTLVYINFDITSGPGDASSRLLGKAIAMNARKNGSLKAISIKDWFSSSPQFEQFINNMNISD